MVLSVLFITVCVVGVIVVLIFLRSVARLFWAHRVLNVDMLVFLQKQGLSDKKAYERLRYEAEITLIKHRVIRFLKEHKDTGLQEAADLLSNTSEYYIGRQETLRDIFSLGSIVVSRIDRADILRVELREDMKLDKAFNVYDAPEKLLKDLGRLARAAKIIGVV